MMTITNDSGKVYIINWCSSVISPGELWINLPFEGQIEDVMVGFDGHIPEILSDFDRCKVFTVSDDNEENEYKGYTLLTHVMMDESGLTLRVKNTEKGDAD